MIEQLRQRLQALQRTAGIGDGPDTLPLGIAAVDAALGGGLARGALHEIAAASEAHLAAATGFALGLAAHEQARVVWIAEDMALAENGVPYGPGLDAFGLAPERLLTVSATHTRDLLWAMEEALRCRAVRVVIGEVRDSAVITVALRRLALAAAESGALALLLRCAPSTNASTAATRWIVGAAPANFVILGRERTRNPETTSEAASGFRVRRFAPSRNDEEIRPRFAAQLVRNRRGPLDAWILEWSDSDECFLLATHAQPVAASALDRPHRQIARQVA
jgi:protein ImuA